MESEQQRPQGAEQIVPKHILESLKNHHDHGTAACLECGYQGRMGIKASASPWWSSLWLAAAIGGIGSLFMPFFIPIAVGGLVVFVGKLKTKYTFDCPNCNSEVVR